MRTGREGYGSAPAGSACPHTSAAIAQTINARFVQSVRIEINRSKRVASTTARFNMRRQPARSGLPCSIDANRERARAIVPTAGTQERSRSILEADRASSCTGFDVCDLTLAEAGAAACLDVQGQHRARRVELVQHALE